MGKGKVGIITEQGAFLYQLYRIENVNLVMSFIKKHPYLIEILFEAYRQVKKIFKEHAVEICLEYDRDSEENFEGLFVIVKTNLSSELSLALLDRFDEEWWLNVDDKISAVLSVMVRSGREK